MPPLTSCCATRRAGLGFLLLAVALLTGFARSLDAADAAATRVFIIAGQSNMVG